MHDLNSKKLNGIYFQHTFCVIYSTAKSVTPMTSSVYCHNRFESGVTSCRVNQARFQIRTITKNSDNHNNNNNNKKKTLRER